LDIKKHESGSEQGNIGPMVSLALKRALSSDNIRKGFKSTRILLQNREAIDGLLAPSQPFGRGQPSAHTGEGAAGGSRGRAMGGWDIVGGGPSIAPALH
jgi:hypothetical protein